MDVRLGSVDFSSPQSSSGPRTGSQAVIFPRTVVDAAVGLTGYSLGYAGDDHHVGRLELRADGTTNDNVVIVDATLGVRDWSGNWDDDYQGTVDFVVVAELETPGTTPPREDVLVTGLELNQAVQFFRAASYLDTSHALPDNAIWLIARKNTGVRAYVDYDAFAGLPPITNLTGSLDVQTGSTSFELAPINAPITPKPDSAINQGVADDTLNFMIPAAWCEGTVTVKCQVWDQNDPTSRSAAFSRTLVFTDVAPLDMYVVGIHYTGGGVNLPAPTQAQFTSQALPQLIKTYPTGDVAQSGYTAIDYGETVTGVIGGSCTDGFSDLLDRLSDMRGGSSDIYVGVLPAGVVNTPGNQIGGCGRGGLAAVFLDFPSDLPHEVGHAFGRKHAPCTPDGRCNPSPANVDDDYPQYGAFPSDSIGVFGFDPTSNTVFNPASTFDFMAYSFPQWVSAYTYSALRGAFSPRGPSGSGAGAHHLQGSQGEFLFLGLEVKRDRSVTRRPSFHHPSQAAGGGGCGEFVVELVDADGKVLICVPVDCGCEESGCHCWPRRVRDAVPWPHGVRKLVVWEGDHEIYSEDVPDPPTVKITSTEENDEGVLVRWSATSPHGKPKDLWYVVHWFDPKDEVWRGVAPRQQERSLVVPRRLFERGAICIRVLATSGIATGYAQQGLSLSDYQPGPGKVDLVLVGGEPGSTQPGSVLYAVATDETGRELTEATIVWHDAAGAEIGRGNQVDLRGTGADAKVVRAVVRHSDGFAAKGWYVSNGPAGIDVRHEVLDRDPRAIAAERDDHHHPHEAPPPPKREGPCPPDDEDDHADG